MRYFKVQPAIARGSREVFIGGTVRSSHLTLGRLAEVGPRRNVLLDLTKEHVVAIVGKRGSGKTHTLGVLVEGLGETQPASESLGSGTRSHAVVVFDTLNLFQWIAIPLEEAAGTAAERQRSLASKWNLQPARLSPTFWQVAGSESVTPGARAFSIRPRDMEPQDWGRLLDIDVITEPMGQLLSEIHVKVTRTGWTSASERHRPLQDYSVSDLIQCLQRDAGLGSDYAPETLRALRQRLVAYDRSGIFSTEGIGWGTLLEPGAVTVFLLGRLPEDLRSVLVFLIIRRLLEERAVASEAAKAAVISGNTMPSSGVPPTWVIIDEAQNIMPSRMTSAANEILTRFVREGRNFGLSLAISSQQPLAIDARVMAQVDTLIAHTLTVRQDVSYVLANLKSAEPTSLSLGNRPITLADAVRQLETGQCLISGVDGERTIFVEVRPRVTLHGGFEA